MNVVEVRRAEVKREEIFTACRRAGIRPGDVVLVHSAMRTIGPIEEGAKTVVNALLEAVGPAGTLVGPAFTFKHENEATPTIDPENDPSEMGAISEQIRQHPKALRSIAFRHSFAAIGEKARVITEVDPRLASFDLRSSFGVMLALNTQVLLLGVTYSSSTSHHFCEWLSDVPYRQIVERPAKICLQKRPLEELTFVDYQPKPSADGSYYGHQTTDFNRLGRMLEEAGRVTITTLGNAMVRRFALRDLCALAEVEAAKDYNIFRTKETETGQSTRLPDGKTAFFNVTDGAGRRGRHELSVVDLSHLSLPPGSEV